jgi:hypothetical protein
VRIEPESSSLPKRQKTPSTDRTFSLARQNSADSLDNGKIEEILEIFPEVPLKEPLPLLKEGVKLSYVFEFLNQHGGRKAFEGLTTTDVNFKFVKPDTASQEVSYCELLKLEGNPAVGQAQVFISHAWKCKFLDVVSALEYHFREEPDIVIWFDLFSNNQHKATELDFYWWNSTFKSAIKQIGRTVMVLAPWVDPIPLTRVLCLYELYCTADTGCKFEVAMSKHDRELFIKDITHDAVRCVNKLHAITNIKKAESSDPQERDRIFEVITKTVGFAAFNSVIHEKLIRSWVVDTARETLLNGRHKNCQCYTCFRDSLHQQSFILHQQQ